MSKNGPAIRELFQQVSLGAPEHAVGFVMWRIVAHYQREVDRALNPLNLTNLQFITLALVAWFEREGDALTQIELARAAGIHPMQVSQTLKALDAKKMVTRQQSRADTRAKRVEITAAGLKILREAMPKVIAVQMRVFGEAGRPGGALLETLIALDQALTQALTQTLTQTSNPALTTGEHHHGSSQQNKRPRSQKRPGPDRQ